MEEIYVGTKVVAAESLDERDFAFGKGQTWDESRPNRPGYRVRYADGDDVDWFEKKAFEGIYRKMTVQEAEMVASGKFVIPDSSRSTTKVA